VRDDGDLGCEPLDQLALALEHACRDEEREVDVLVTGRLDALVEGALDRLPERVTVRLDHHRAADRRVLGQSGAANHLAVPAGEILALVGQRVRIHERSPPVCRRTA
jgi:hypothetical protein